MRIEFDDPAAFREHLAKGGLLASAVVQSLDLADPECDRALLLADLAGCVFLGCRMGEATLARAVRQGALVMPPVDGLPYRPFRGSLYTVGELYRGFHPERPGSYEATPDSCIHRHYRATNQGPKSPLPVDVVEGLFRRLHDHSMWDAFEEVLQGRRVVAIMGGHRLSRSSPPYRDVAWIAKRMAESDALVISGGGPGAMEAAHLGGWFRSRPDAELEQALQALDGAPDFHEDRVHEWLAPAWVVRSTWPKVGGRVDTVGVPTWQYGHEPPNVFADRVAKYFANSEREDGLLAVARHGVVYAPGSAGTVQEIFQDAAQNHYETFSHASPMVLLGETYWRVQRPVFQLLAQMAAGHPWARLVHIVDGVDPVVRILQAFQPPEA